MISESPDHTVRRDAPARDVAIRELDSLEAVRDAEALFAALWAEPATPLPLPAHLLRALQVSGNYVAGAFVGTEVVGASVAWACPGTGAAGSPDLHSHATAVTSAWRRSGVGLAIKLHQRAWALERGIGAITWTFDPLIRRNARFNLHSLAARATGYAENLYGVMEDPLNLGSESDRLFVRWELAAAPGEGESGEGVARPAEPALALSDRSDRSDRSDGMVKVPTPIDIEALRTTDPSAAAEWRQEMRTALGARVKDGWRIEGIDEDGCYLVAPPSDRTVES